MTLSRIARRASAVLALSLGLALSPATDALADGGKHDFTLRDIDNKEVKLSDYRGKVVLMNFWATWCQPCMAEMPHLEALYKELGPDKFVVLSVAIDDARSASMVKPIVKRNRLTFPVVLDKETVVVSQYNPGKTLPYTVIFDPEGEIFYQHMGYTPGDEVDMKAKVLEALGGAPAPADAASTAPE